METVGWVTLPDELGEAFANWSRNSSNRTIYNALFIMTNSFLEWALIEACRLTALYLKDDFIVYRKEQGIFKANNYLTEKLGIKLNANKEWSRFNVNQAVRNLIVHNGANVNKEYTKKQEEQPEYQLLKTNKRYFDMTETGFIYILRHDYILESHKLAKDFVQQTAEAIKTELVKNHDVKWE